MEMDSTSRGRSFDRSSRDPATLKKPRLLAEDPSFLHSSGNIPNGGGRPLVQRQPTLGFRPAPERDRDSEISDSARGGGGGYQPQSLSQSQLQQHQHQHQELVSQYRTALSELTFNSKPIITNLTIIAGENLHAAKAIAATICNNILEVPSDQKLPSLYLLDSIVKNIGRDYIKYFAARLPEVFCKAYRQVDPAVHPGMRHLFGTWKGVFSPQSLQVIEKELGFQPAVNGSPSGVPPSRAESQAQHPGRSIHVNPKYLEARQRLQQSTMAKTATIDTNLIKPPEDTERRDRSAASISSARPRTDPRLKAQRDAESGSIRENDGAPYSEFDYGSDMNSLDFGKTSEIVAAHGFEKSWYGSGGSSIEAISGQRNGIDIKHGFPNYSAPLSANVDVKSQNMNTIASKRGSEVNRSWKNSEEEEYMWDDMNSRAEIPGKIGGNSKRDPRTNFESEKLDLGSRVDREASTDSLSAERQDGAAFRQPMPSVRSHGSSLSDGLRHLGSRRNLPDHPEGYSTSFSGASTSLSQTPLQPLIGSAHIGAQGLGVPLNSTTGQTLADQRPAPLSRIPHYSLPGADGKPAQSRGQKNTPLSVVPISHMGNSQKPHTLTLQTPLHQLQSHPKKRTPSEPSQSLTPKNANLLVGSLDRSKSPIAEAPGSSSTSNLLASISSIFGNKSNAGSGSGSGSIPKSSSQIATASSAANPVSSLLSTLVAKGLISASKADSASHDQAPTRSQSPKTDTPSVSTGLPNSSTDEPSISNSDAKSTDIKSLIGFEFKPDVIRRSHPAVISDLVEDLPHQCHMCGLRFKLKERFERHIEWHALKTPELNGPNKASRRWFTNSDDWINEKPEFRAGNEAIGMAVEIDGERMVVADEGQCVCILCGEVFDDFYSREMDKWMFKGAVHLSIVDGEIGPIVHADCISENSLSELGLANGVKRE